MAFCAACGQSLTEDDRFCPQCGAKVRRDRAPSPAPPAPAVATLSDAAGPLPENRDHLGAPQYGSMFRSGEDPAPETVRERRGFSTIAVLLGALGLIGLSGVVGYRWFARPAADAAPLSAVAETEQLLTPQPAGKTEGGHAERPVAQSAPGDRQADTSRPPRAGGWTVVAVETRDVKAAGEATATSDGRTAVIAPGGALALAWTAPFYNGEGPDVRLFGPEGDRTPYTIFARAGTDGKWVRFDSNARGFPAGVFAHDFGHHKLESAQQIMIRNDGVINLYIDAIVPLHDEPEAHGADAAKHRDPH